MRAPLVSRRAGISFGKFVQLLPLGALLLTIAATSVSAQDAAAPKALKLSTLFGDNACVQADRPIAVWGWAPEGQKVSVTLGTSKAEATAGKEGKWTAQLPALKPGGPYILTATGGGTTLTSKNILVGQVWLASGQSNMFFPMAKTQNAQADIDASKNDQIRLFCIHITPTRTPAADADGQWEVCSPESVAKFSGVAYHFGRKLQKELKQPVGLIQSSLGGTPIEAWTPTEAWSTSPELEKIRQFDVDAAKIHQQKRYEAVLGKWKQHGSKGPEPKQEKVVDQNEPSVDYNSGIAPTFPYTIAGFLWYQGEWNVSRSAQYGLMLKTLITQWRALWGEGDLPFLVVQLPNYGKEILAPVDTHRGIMELREAQLAALTLPNTGVATTIDLGDGQLHPPNKKPVGERLALLALAKAYKREVVCDGPTVLKVEPQGNAIVVRFEHAIGLHLDLKDNLSGFAIAGDDRQYHFAKATVSANAVTLTSSDVPAPKYVRYLWANNPKATLFNKEGLAAGPFRTDDWDADVGKGDAPAAPQE